jgi:hypothetical protein
LLGLLVSAGVKDLPDAAGPVSGFGDSLGRRLRRRWPAAGVRAVEFGDPEKHNFHLFGIVMDVAKPGTRASETWVDPCVTWTNIHSRRIYA